MCAADQADPAEAQNTLSSERLPVAKKGLWGFIAEVSCISPYVSLAVGIEAAVWCLEADSISCSTVLPMPWSKDLS